MRFSLLAGKIEAKSKSEQYRDLTLYFEELGETELAAFYKELSLVEGK